MRIIKKRKLLEFFSAHQQGARPLPKWFAIARKAHWRSFDEMRSTFPHADEFRVKSGRKAVIFNIKKNDYRLITGVHYERDVRDEKGSMKRVEGKIYLFFFLTHTEYDKELWKAQL